MTAPMPCCYGVPSTMQNRLSCTFRLHGHCGRWEGVCCWITYHPKSSFFKMAMNIYSSCNSRGLVKTSELGLSRVGPAQAVQLGCSHRGFGWTVHFQGISHTFGKAVLAADRKLHVLPCGLLCGAALECALHRDFCRLPQESVLCGAEGLLYHTNSMFLFVHLCLSHCHMTP